MPAKKVEAHSFVTYSFERPFITTYKDKVFIVAKDVQEPLYLDTFLKQPTKIIVKDKATNQIVNSVEIPTFSAPATAGSLYYNDLEFGHWPNWTNTFDTVQVSENILHIIPIARLCKLYTIESVPKEDIAFNPTYNQDIVPEIEEVSAYTSQYWVVNMDDMTIGLVKDKKIIPRYAWELRDSIQDHSSNWLLSLSDEMRSLLDTEKENISYTYNSADGFKDFTGTKKVYYEYRLDTPMGNVVDLFDNSRRKFINMVTDPDKYDVGMYTDFVSLKGGYQWKELYNENGYPIDTTEYPYYTDVQKASLMIDPIVYEDDELMQKQSLPPWEIPLLSILGAPIYRRDAPDIYVNANATKVFTDKDKSLNFMSFLYDNYIGGWHGTPTNRHILYGYCISVIKYPKVTEGHTISEITLEKTYPNVNIGHFDNNFYDLGYPGVGTIYGEKKEKMDIQLFRSLYTKRLYYIYETNGFNSGIFNKDLLINDINASIEYNLSENNIYNYAYYNNIYSSKTTVKFTCPTPIKYNGEKALWKLHFKVNVYADEQCTQLITQVNSQTNPELFKLKDAVFPSSGVSSEDYGKDIFIDVEVGPRKKVYIKIDVGANDG